MSADICSIVASFLAFGILRMRGTHGKAGWRYLFLIECVYLGASLIQIRANPLSRGSITLAIGIATFFRMPPSPTQTRSWFRPKGWFNEREETIIVSRILRDDPTKGDMHNRQALSIKRIWKAIWDYDLWPLYIMYVHHPHPCDISFSLMLARAIQRSTVRNSCFATWDISYTLAQESWVCSCQPQCLLDD